MLISLIMHLLLIFGNQDLAVQFFDLFSTHTPRHILLELFSELNYAVNFYIYVLTAQQFRRQLMRSSCASCLRRETGGRYQPQTRRLVFDRRHNRSMTTMTSSSTDSCYSLRHFELLPRHNNDVTITRRHLATTVVDIET